MNQYAMRLSQDEDVHFSPEHAIPFLLQKRKRKSIAIRISDDSYVLVSAPSHMSLTRIKGFVDQKYLWIQAHKKKASMMIVLPTLSASEKRAWASQVRSKAEQFLEGYAGKKPRRLFIRYSKTRWGSCSSLGNISLNGYLYFLPNELFQYVICHELSHLEHLNHSRAFWDHLSVMIETPRAKKLQLNQYKIPADTK